MKKTIEETEAHRSLKEALREIAVTCGFRADSEVSLNFSGAKDENGVLVDEASIDVAFFGEEERKRFLFVFQCKESDLSKPNKDILQEQSVCERLLANKGTVIYSDDRQIQDSDLRDINELKICYVFGERLRKARYDELVKIFSRRSIDSWDSNALQYFKKVATTIGVGVKYEILKEFDVTFEVRTSTREDAVRIKQNHHEMFFFGAMPSELIKIGYVSRRASGRPSAYQRILSAERIRRISDFVKSKEAMLPNAIIIAFDSDKDVQNAIKFEDGKLSFPLTYCCAWIIDGQHRVYGFLKTKFEKKSTDQFRLPVVAFKNLRDILQNRTFVNINYNQKKIDPTLLCDLATSVPDLQNELAWPSLLVSHLNKSEPLQGLVKISEMDRGKPISIASFARYGLLESLLGYDRVKRMYNGPLNSYSPFNPRASYNSAKNQAAFRKQAELLRRYFAAVAEATKKKDASRDPWKKTKEFALLKPTGINALLLVLSRILKVHPDGKLDMARYLKPLASMNFSREFIVRRGGGWKGFRNTANIMIKKLNKKHGASLQLFGKKDKS
ncbi:MAG: DGQHR domain-containing protein [Ignavibacteriales bacterium]|nr:DGQHR domain-containing protein [Ignavibacteriales bacterium]